MAVNAKKPYRIKNRTNHYHPENSRSYNHFVSPDSYGYREQKIEGYENRLYWQFKYCQDHDGATYFYTLTYNDNALPKYFGINCFDYEDLRDFLTGGFRKKLLREYGSLFKYFIGAELGDGKGKRGLYNNPHYHVLLFIENAHNPRFPYKKITEKELTHLVRNYWQGFDEDTDGFHPYETAKYGMVGISDEGALITDFRGEKYCAKYVTKDVNLRKKEAYVKFKLQEKYTAEYDVFDEAPYYDYYVEKMHDLLQIDSDECPTIQQIQTLIDEANLFDDFCLFIDIKIAEKVRLAFNEYRNRYCNKCRISHGVGDYALNFISNPLEPRILVPDKDGLKMRPIGMYYYRKLFCDVVKDAENQNLYVLNELGRQYKLHNAPKQIEKFANRAKSILSVLTPELYEKVLNSDANTEVYKSYTWERFKNDLNNNDLNKITNDYGTFKLVYEDRFCKLHYDADSDDWSFPTLNPLDDYERFLTPSFYLVSYRPGRLDRFLAYTPKDYISYHAHPYFLPNIRIFSVLDACADYLFIQKDDKRQKDAEEIADAKRFHAKRKIAEKISSYYSNFLK